MNTFRFSLLVVCLAFLSSMAWAEVSYPLTITDSYDRTVTLAEGPARIVSLAPSVTETVFALGKGASLVGRTDYCDYPPEASQVASVGSLRQPNIETIVALQPDLVIASTHFQKDTLAALERAGLTVAVIYGPESFDGVYHSIRSIARMLDAERQSEAIVQEMKETLRQVTSRVRGADPPKVYYVIGFGEHGDYTAGGNTFIGGMIEMAGGDNIASDVEGWAFSLEKIVERNPDLLICSKYFGIPESVAGANGYRDLPAVRQGKLFPIDNNMIDRQGPRLAEGLRALAEIIHPELFR